MALDEANATKGEGAGAGQAQNRASLINVTPNGASASADLAVAEAARLVAAGYRVQTVVPGKKEPARGGHGADRPDYSANPEDFAGKDLAVVCGPCDAVGAGRWLVLLDRDGDAPWSAYGFPEPLPATVSSKDDHHRFYVVPAHSGLKGWTDVFGTKAQTGSALDISAAGKLSFEYPSTNARGVRVEWDGAPLGAAHPAELPQSAIDHILATRRKRTGALTSESKAIARSAVAGGARNAVDLARRFAETCPPSIEGEGGDSALFMAAVGIIRGCDLDLETGLGILRDVYNPRCQPPWDDSRLEYKAQQALEESDAPRGSLLPSPDRAELDRLFALADDSKHVPVSSKDLTAFAAKAQRRDTIAATALRALRDGETVTESQRNRALAEVYRQEPLASPKSAATVLGVSEQAAREALFAPLLAAYPEAEDAAEADAPQYVLDAAKRFLEATGYVFNTDRGRWLGYDGGRGVWVEKHDAMARLDELLPHGSLRDRAARVLSDAAALRPVKQDTFDPRVLLNVENGTLELQANPPRFRDHLAEDYSTRTAPVRYVPGARHPRWDQYIDELTGGDRELAAYLQRAVGYALIADGREKAAFFAYGPSNSGKTLFVKVLSVLLGGDGASENASTFIRRLRSTSHSEDRASLAGKRIIVVDEFPAGAEFDVEFINRLTGGLAVSSSHKGGRQFTWTPRAAVWFASETAPQSNAAVEGFRNRLRVIPFKAKFEPDPDFQTRLMQPEVLSAALNWALEGLAAYRADGLGTSVAVEAAREAYAADNKPSVDVFLDERCAREPEAWTPVRELHAHYRDFCLRHGVRHPDSLSDFSRRLDALGFALKRRGGHKVTGRLGVRLLTTSELSGRDEASATPRVANLGVN